MIYDANYGHFQAALDEEIRREAFGEDIEQNSWLTADEQDAFVRWLDLAARARLLDVACGAGGPSLRIAARTGCSIVGIDAHEQAISAALRGGFLSAFYLVGRLIGVPAAGFLSDRLFGRGTSRQSVAVAFLFLTAVLLCMMPIGIYSTSILGAMACLLGASRSARSAARSTSTEASGSSASSVACLAPAWHYRMPQDAINPLN